MNDISKKELEGLAVDVFRYFGLGCRNVSKIFLPRGYELDKLFKVFYKFHNIINHEKYKNNYDYNKAIFLMGDHKLIENGFLLMKEEESVFSPVAMLYYEYYDNLSNVESFISNYSDDIQCVVSKTDVDFGSSQSPNLWEYADQIDTIHFLRTL